MRNVLRLDESRSARPVWLSASAVALAAAVAGTAGIAAGPGKAATRHAAKASHTHKLDRFKHPKLRHGALTIEGTEASDRIALRLQAGDPGVLQVDVGDDGSADFSFERADVASIAVDAAEGDDSVRIDESNGAFTDTIPTTIDGGPGDDTIAGGKGVETLRGGDGNDTIDGNGGNDTADLGAGDDTFVWDPGDGSDTIEGQDGTDRMIFNGAAGAEQMDLSANGNRLKFFRTQGNVTMDTAGVELVDVNALGGATGDGQADRVVVNGTNGDDTIRAFGDATEVTAKGLDPLVAIRHSEGANDRLEINTLAGTDSVQSAGLTAGAIQLFVDGLLVP